MRATTSTNMSVLKAILVADCIAKAKKPFNIGEELILPATKDICRERFGEVAVKNIANISLLASTITRRTDEIVKVVEAQLLKD